MSPSYVESVEAATAVVGYDLLKEAYFNQLTENRVIRGIGVAGSTAIGDTEIEVFIDQVKVGNYYNTRLGFPNEDDMVKLEALGVPGGARIHAYVVDAPATNPIQVRLEDLAQ